MNTATPCGRRPIATTPAAGRAEIEWNSPLGSDWDFLPEGKENQLVAR